MMMKSLTKNVFGAGAAAVALVAMSVPAQARDYYGRDRDGISAGEIIAGAVVLGGLAAILSSGKSNDRYDNRYDYQDYNRGGDTRHDRGYNNYDQRGGSRSAVNQCISGVENYANRYSRSKVTEIRDIERTRYGYRVSGKLVVQDGYRGRDRYDRGSQYDRYGRGYDRGDDRRDDRRYDRGYDRGYDKGKFTCYVERGRVVDIDYSGLDQWR
jgi:hypothetical protein